MSVLSLYSLEAAGKKTKQTKSLKYSQKRPVVALSQCHREKKRGQGEVSEALGKRKTLQQARLNTTDNRR